MPKPILPLLTLFLLAAPAGADAPATQPSDADKITALITAVADLKDATFVRKGSEHDTATAVKFLRWKYAYYASDIKTVHDFIRICSAGGDGSGTPYYVRRDRQDTPAKDFFAAELAKIESP